MRDASKAPHLFISFLACVEAVHQWHGCFDGVVAAVLLHNSEFIAPRSCPLFEALTPETRMCCVDDLVEFLLERVVVELQNHQLGVLLDPLFILRTPLLSDFLAILLFPLTLCGFV